MPSLEVVQIQDDECDTMQSDDDKTIGIEEHSISSSTPVQEGSKTIVELSEKPIPCNVVVATEELPVNVKKSAAKQVTPADETVLGSSSSTSSRKQKQQRKVNQMTLGNFFFGVKETSTVPKSPPVATRTSPRKKSSKTSKAVVTTMEKPCDDQTACEVKSIDFKKKETVVAKDSTKDCKEDKMAPYAPSKAPPATSPRKVDKETTPKRKKATATKKTATPKVLEEKAPELSEERKALLKKYSGMKTRYARRAQDLVEEAKKGLPEEDFTMPELHTNKEEGEGNDYSDNVIATMVLLIEGSSLPLSTLAENVSQKLLEFHEKKWTSEAVSSKIKLLSQRKSYMESSSAVDLFEDDSQDRMWRWEILTIDILPSSVLSMVRKARSARKKLSSHRTATTRLIQALEDAEALIANPAEEMDKHMAKVSQNEEKVLKYEREAEKKRMAEQAKRRKLEEIEAKKREKELEKERKKLEAEKKKQEIEAKKDEATKAREEAKRKREVEKEQKAEQKKVEEEEQKKKLGKQKACLISFFSGPPKKKARTPSNGSAGELEIPDEPQPEESKKKAVDSFDVEAFRTSMNSSGNPAAGPLFPQLSAQAISSRKRRIGKVALSVYVTVEPENAFDAQPFAEEKVMSFRNKYRFLSFHEDCRPAYHGTWSKKSTTVTGKTPFAKDALHLDYDYDSEAEWEEGDDEIGEDIENEEKCKDEDDDEGDARIYDYDDGFCVADDRYLDSEDDVDEETKALHQKKLQKGEGQGSLASRVCIVAPAIGGVPATGDESLSDHIEGLDTQEATAILESHQAAQLSDVLLCLDAFPPPLAEESQAPPQASVSPAGDTAGKDDYSPGQMRALAQFAHHCELNSKEKLIEALRIAHPTMFTSRAKATRQLDTIAMKQRFVNTTGVYWEVKKAVLEQLELHDVLAMAVVDEKPKKVDAASPVGSSTAKAEKKKKTKKRKSPSLPIDAAKPANKNAKKRKSPVKPIDLAKPATKNAKKRKSPAKSVTGEKPATKTGRSPAKVGDTNPKKTNGSAAKADAKQSPKKPEPPAMKASANLLAGFLIKKKPKKDGEPKSPTVSA